jgi:hypothetical protein
VAVGSGRRVVVLFMRASQLAGVMERQQAGAQLRWRVEQLAVGARRAGCQYGEDERQQPSVHGSAR